MGGEGVVGDRVNDDFGDLAFEGDEQGSGLAIS